MTRLFMEAWMIAHGLRQEAITSAQQEEVDTTRKRQEFEARADAWTKEASQKYRVVK